MRSFELASTTPTSQQQVRSQGVGDLMYNRATVTTLGIVK